MAWQDAHYYGIALEGKDLDTEAAYASSVYDREVPDTLADLVAALIQRANAHAKFRQNVFRGVLEVGGMSTVVDVHRQVDSAVKFLRLELFVLEQFQYGCFGFL